MRYQAFVDRRTAVWDEFEQRLATAQRQPRRLDYEDLERLTLLYRQVLHDHSIAAARFPGTATARRLRQHVLAGTHWLQRDSGDRLPSVRHFFSHGFPDAFRKLLPLVGVTSSLFAVSAVLGFALTTMDSALGTLFLPPESVAGLRQGELWTESIFAVMPGAIASTAIATNNLGVCLTAWAGGVLAGLGAFYIVLLNGLMLGAVLAMTARFSMFDRLLEFIAAHGPLEISLILVSAAAGLHMGRALVMESDRPRAQALRTAGRDALLVLFGCLPWIVVLGFVEGFVSPSDLPLATKAALGLLLEAVFLSWALMVGRDPVERDPVERDPVGRDPAHDGHATLGAAS